MTLAEINDAAHEQLEQLQSRDLDPPQKLSVLLLATAMTAHAQAIDSDRAGDMLARAFTALRPTIIIAEDE